MKQIIIVNGAPESGKTTFEQCTYAIVHENNNDWADCFIFSTVDFVKTIASYCGWDGTKTGKNRKFLSDLKDLLTEWGDVPAREIEKQINKIEEKDKKVLIFVDCREPEEIEKLRVRLGAKTLLIRRPNNRVEITNHADEKVEDYNYDYTIENDGTIYELWCKAKDFLENFE